MEDNSMDWDRNELAREIDIKQLTESSKEMVSFETVDKAAKHFKYFVVGEIMDSVPGYVPPTGSNINSKDWEKYRVMTMMSIYQPIIALHKVFA